MGGRGGEGVEVSHLLFVEDTLIICEASKDQLLHLHWVLMWFEVISKLKINLEKSELILVGRVPIMEELADILGCKMGLLPSKYLGLPLGSTFKSTTMWDLVEERMQRKLAKWKRQYLSKGGGVALTLNKSTLSRLPFISCPFLLF